MLTHSYLTLKFNNLFLIAEQHVFIYNALEQLCSQTQQVDRTQPGLLTALLDN